MSNAHVCDECKTAAPTHENAGWWNLEAANTSAGQILTFTEKPDYDFCSWKCLATFSARMAAGNARARRDGDAR